VKTRPEMRAIPAGNAPPHPTLSPSGGEGIEANPSSKEIPSPSSRAEGIKGTLSSYGIPSPSWEGEGRVRVGLDDA
jgi:hypothetical protein